MVHILPQSHKELLQAILRCLILQADQDATFVEYEPPIEVKPELDGFGRPVNLGGTTDPR